MPSSKSSVDKRDLYYRKGKSDGYRARSAYKLLHLDEEFDLFRGVGTAVDLCAAPGSWSQVLGKRLRPATSSARVVSIDLQPMAPLPGITTLQADITRPDTVPRVLDALGGRKADLVICDGAPDVTGVHELDVYLHSQLLLAALTLSLTLLSPHATLIFKIFLSPLDPTAAVLRSQLRAFFPGPTVSDSGLDTNNVNGHGQTADGFAEFDDNRGPEDLDDDVLSTATASTWGPGFDVFGRRGGVWVRKPRSSRKGSGEAFIVCRNFDPSSVPLPTEFTPEALEALRQTVGSTLTLESLATLNLAANGTTNSSSNGTGNGTAPPTWPATKGFVGGGDLNRDSSPRIRTAPLLSVKVDKHKRRSSVSSLDEAPSPVESSFGLFPSPLTTTPTPVSPAFRNHQTWLRSPVDSSSHAQMSTPQPLPSPVLGVLDHSPSREWRELATSPLLSQSHSSSGFSHGHFVPHLGSPPPTHQLDPSSSLSPREHDIYHNTPQGDGAVSPALSSSSKTDLFFAASQRDSLPVPPPPLAGSATSLGRANSLGRGIPPIARARVVTTPAGPPALPHDAQPHLSPPPIAPTPLRAVTGPRPIELPTSPSPTTAVLGPKQALPTPTGHPHHLAREKHHGESDDVPVKAGDLLVPVTDDTDALRTSDSPGTWRLSKPLGQGAFAEVWAASPETNGGEVAAVKLVDRAACARNSRTAIAFYREVEVLRHLVHPGIVGYISHFSTPTHHCLVLERVGGGEAFAVVEDESLHERMIKAGPGDPEGYGLVRRIFGELCRAVAWLHEVEVVHRDIKLENILFTVNPFSLPPTSTGSVPLDRLPVPLVKLTDFGLSRFIRADSPLLTTRCGSEAYAAPEVVMGNLYDGRRTDAWALGVVLYVLVTGELPFDDGAPPPPGRARAGSTTSTSSAGGDARDARRRTMHRIAKGEYGWRDGPNAPSPAVRAIVGRLLTRDPVRRARVAQLWDMPWMAEGPGAVPPPNEPMAPTGQVDDDDDEAHDYAVAMSRRASDTPHVVVHQGVLVDHERIDEVARFDVAAEA